MKIDKPVPMLGKPIRRLGFTILELLSVLLVMSLLAAFTVRWYFSDADVTLENASVLLARDLHSAQHRAIFLDKETHFTFLPDGSGYTVTDPDGTLARNPQTDEPFTRVYPHDGVFDGVLVLEADAGGDRTLELDSRGRTLEDLSVTLGFEGHERVVILKKGTSTVTIVGSTSGWVDNEG